MLCFLSAAPNLSPVSRCYDNVVVAVVFMLIVLPTHHCYYNFSFYFDCVFIWYSISV